MPRKRKVNTNLPPRMRVNSVGMYYYDHGAGPDGRRRWTPLSKDLKEAKLKWARIEAETEAAQEDTFAELAKRYMNEVAPKKAKSTYRGNLKQVKKLKAVFGSIALSNIRPVHIGRYLDDNPAKVAANREIALMSHMFKWAMRKGLADLNPCSGVARNKEKPRDRYIEDWEFQAVKTVASEHMQAVMDLAYITGMRLGDLLAITRGQLEAEGIRIKTQKTEKKQFIVWTPALRDIVPRLKALRSPVASLYLICTRRGQPYTEDGFSTLWQRTIVKAYTQGVIAQRFTFHDIRAKTITDAEEQGLDPQRLAGHATAKQTETYLRAKRTEKTRPVEPNFKAIRGNT